MTEAEFDRVMHAYWHSLEGVEPVRRVSLYIAKAAERMAAAISDPTRGHYLERQVALIQLDARL